MAVSNREQQIIVMYELGNPVAKIAADLGLSAKYVQARVGSLCNGNGADRLHAKATERGSRELRQAIAAARGMPEQDEGAAS